MDRQSVVKPGQASRKPHEPVDACQGVLHTQLPPNAAYVPSEIRFRIREPRVKDALRMLALPNESVSQTAYRLLCQHVAATHPKVETRIVTGRPT